MTVLPVNVDDDLIEPVDTQAAKSCRSRAKVLAAAIRRGLGGGRLAETLAAYRTGEEISDDDAMALAKAELAAARTERTTARAELHRTGS